MKVFHCLDIENGSTIVLKIFCQFLNEWWLWESKGISEFCVCRLRSSLNNRYERQNHRRATQGLLRSAEDDRETLPGHSEEGGRGRPHQSPTPRVLIWSLSEEAESNEKFACTVCGTVFENVHKRSAHMNKHRKQKGSGKEPQSTPQKSKLIKKEKKGRDSETHKKHYEFYEQSDDDIFDMIKWKLFS